VCREIRRTTSRGGTIRSPLYLCQAAGGRLMQAGGGMGWQYTTPAPTAWIRLAVWQKCSLVQRLPQEPQSPSESARARPPGGLPPPALAGGE